MMRRAVGSASLVGATVVALKLLLRRRRALSSSVTFETLDVFTDARFGGNQLAVVFDERERLSDADMQALAAEFGYSETTFVLPPRDAAHTARVRIFSPTGEMPFAGHPNVGTATSLAWRGALFGRAVRERVLLEELAGVVPVEILRDEEGRPAGAMLTAPEPFAVPEPSLDVE